MLDLQRSLALHTAGQFAWSSICYCNANCKWLWYCSKLKYSGQLDGAVCERHIFLTWLNCTEIFGYVTSSLIADSLPVYYIGHILSSKHKTPSCRWGTARARCQLKSGKMLHKCSTDCTWKGLQPANDLQGHLRSLTLVPFDRPHTISY